MAGSENDNYHSILARFMALEDDLLERGELNVYAHRARDLANTAARLGTIVEVDGQEHMVLRAPLDEKDIKGGNFVLPAGFDLTEAMLKLIKECKPHWGVVVNTTTDIANEAFGLDGVTVPTLAAQGRFVKEECGGDGALAAARAKEYGTSLGSLTPGRRPSSEKGKTLPPAADAIRKNPWLTEPKNVNDPNDPIMVRRIGIIKSLGSRVADGLAKAANKTLAGAPRRVA